MVYNIVTDPSQLGSWATLLWRMLEHLGVPEGDLPAFHARSSKAYGRVRVWIGWVTVRAPNMDQTFRAARGIDHDARLEAARKAVLYLRHQFDEIFLFTQFRLIPQASNEGNNILVPAPSDDEEDETELETAHHIASAEILHDGLYLDYKDTALELVKLTQENYNLLRSNSKLRAELRRRRRVDGGEESSCGENPPIPEREMTPVSSGKPSQPQGFKAAPRKRMTSREYLRLFTPRSSQGGASAPAPTYEVVPPAAEEEEEDPSECEEESTVGVWYTTSSSPTHED